jgi:hypothetical protein
MSANSHIFPFHLANTKTSPTYNFFFLFSFHSSFLFSPLLSLVSFNSLFLSTRAGIEFSILLRFLVFFAFETENYKLCTMATFFFALYYFLPTRIASISNSKIFHYIFMRSKNSNKRRKKSSFRNSPMTLDGKERKNSHPP